MISRLSISNYALIRDIEFNLTPGLNIITGETGAGKSIILGALSLLQGRRADPKVVSDPEDKSVVEGEFELTPDTAAIISPILASADIPSLDGYCVLRREITPTGRSRAFINDSPVTLNTLQEVSAHLVDIHSQHKNLNIADPDFQLKVIDELAGNGVLLKEYQDIFRQYRDVLNRYTSTRDIISQTAQQADFLEYQLKELETLNPSAEEYNELVPMRESLATSAAVGENIRNAAVALTWGTPNATELISQAIDSLTKAAEDDPTLEQLKEQLKTIGDSLNAITEELENKTGSSTNSAEDLAEIENRISKYETLIAKHKVADINALVALRNNITKKLCMVADADVILGDIEAEARKLKRSAIQIADKLSELRTAAAADLVSRLCSRATPLGLDNLICQIPVTTGKLNPSGHDTIQFLFSFNKNQEPMPIGQTASGGEISRVMLALKSILAEHINLPTIIFDEIDTGVSGDVAVRMGALMEGISHSLQVIAITHLPAVAAKGATHFKVFKQDNDTSTVTNIRRLDQDQRRHEIALMLSGDADDVTALATADKLLNRKD